MRKPAGFDKKLQHSIELLQKGEKLALKYDANDGFFLAFSGGKDSQALYHVAQMCGVKFKAHMNFTSIDPPQVIRFVRTQYPDVVTHAPEKSIFALAVDRGILPSMRIRWCCADLKETAGAGKVTLIGIRKQESVRRAKRHEVEVSNRQFSGSLDEFEVWQKEQIEKKEQKLIRKMRKEGKKVNEDEFSLQTDNEVRCINGKDSILISPIFEWTEQDVWYFLNEVVKVPHCELYDQGYKRIGCILCPMSPYRQKVKEMKDFPHVKRGWIKAIKEIHRGGCFTKNLYGGTSEQTGSSTQRTTGSSNIGEYPPPTNHPKLERFVSADWQRKIRIFNGKMASFRSGNILHFEHIGQAAPPNGRTRCCSSETASVRSITEAQTRTSRHWQRQGNSGIWAGFRIAHQQVA